MKFFVFFAEEYHPNSDLLQKLGDWFKGEKKVYKVAAYLKNKRF